MSYWLVGEKYDYSLRKNADARWKRCKRGKGEIFSVLGREKGEGAKISYFGKFIHHESLYISKGRHHDHPAQRPHDKKIHVTKNPNIS